MNIKVENQIHRVTVYPDRALISCRGNCQLTAGLHQLQIDELPLTLLPDSVRVGGLGSAQVRILGVDVRRQHFVETPAAKAQQLEQVIEQTEDELRVLEDEKAGWLSHGKYVEGLRQSTTELAKGLSRGKTGIEDQAKLTQFLREQDAELRGAIRKLDSKKRDLTKHLEKLRQELKEISSARPRQRYQALIEVEATSKGDFQPELSYLVRNASWQPLYDIRLTHKEGDQNAGSSLEISYIAQITQNSGQDWTGVDLVVSTARPALNQQLPELKPWYVDQFRPPQPLRPVRKEMAVRSAAAPAATSLAAEAEPSEVLEAEPAVAAQVAIAEVQDSGTAVSFAVSGRIDIPSDGSPHKTTLNMFSAAPNLDYLTVPKLTNAVFRRATMMNNTPTPFLPGQANLFVADEYIGRSQVEYTPTGGEIELQLGVEERITVERELIKREVDKRLLRDNRQLRYGYQIELENVMTTVVKIEIRDHIPVSRHEQIRIKLESVQPDPTERSDMNIMEWHLELDPGEKQSINYEYSVDHPRTLQVAGLLD